ncbi:MAG: hypothetical protein R3344_15010, partial [Acidobacteriota bacterium]|nr:hypothetical protein [Acidobacteriota bacterium]
VPLDVERRATRGSPVRVLSEISRSLERVTGTAHYGVSDEGTLVYAAPFGASSHLTWFDRSGNRLATVGEPMIVQNFTLSPDESRLAVNRGAGEALSIWITDLERGVSTELVPSSFADYVIDPVWSADSQRVAFTSPRDRRVFTVPAGGGQPVLLSRLPGEWSAVSEAWSPDGRFLAALVIDDKTRGAIVPLDVDQTPIVFDEAVRIDELRFSPDGRWLAYNADRAGSGMEVFVVPCPPTGERVQVSVAGGSQAHWRRDGRELFYLSMEGTLMSVSIDTTSGFSAAAPVPLFDTGILVDTGLDQYAVTGDGQRFLIASPVLDGRNDSTGRIVVVLDWFEELKRLAPVP